MTTEARNLYLAIFTTMDPSLSLLDWVVLYLGWNVAFQLVDDQSIALKTVKVDASNCLEDQTAAQPAIQTFSKMFPLWYLFN